MPLEPEQQLGPFRADQLAEIRRSMGPGRELLWTAAQLRRTIRALLDHIDALTESNNSCPEGEQTVACQREGLCDRHAEERTVEKMAQDIDARRRLQHGLPLCASPSCEGDCGNDDETGTCNACGEPDTGQEIDIMTRGGWCCRSCTGREERHASPEYHAAVERGDYSTALLLQPEPEERFVPHCKHCDEFCREDHPMGHELPSAQPCEECREDGLAD